MDRPTKLSDYPFGVVRLDCALCERRGCYRLARLAARYGPEQSLEGLLAELAGSCPWWRNNPRKYEPRCGARYLDLERTLPPEQQPPTPATPPAPGRLFRQRQPDREDLPSAQAKPAAPVRGPDMLSQCRSDVVSISCRRCPRRATFVPADLLRLHGDLPMTELLKRLVPDCPRVHETQAYELCQVKYERR